LRFQPKLAAGLGDTVNELLSMSTGSGASGSGSGYTAMRSTLMNVGLYGAIPMIAHESSGGGGQADRGIASRDQGSPDGNNNPDASSNTGQLRATGAGEASVPPQYKKSVGEYFQRVDDELSQ
jgi:hypothetical protein